MRPYSGKALPEKKEYLIRYRHSRARRNAESAFGILSNKWKIFHKPINLDYEFAKQVLETCCALHNFVRDRDGIVVEETYCIVGLTDIQPEETTQRRPANQYNTIRDKLAEYFSSDEGSLPWQKKNSFSRYCYHLVILLHDFLD